MMIHIFKEIVPLVLDAAPTIATALGSPIAGVAVSILGKAFGTSSDPAAVIQAIQSNADSQSILSNLEAQHMPWLSAAMAMTKPNSIELTIKVNW